MTTVILTLNRGIKFNNFMFVKAFFCELSVLLLTKQKKELFWIMFKLIPYCV